MTHGMRNFLEPTIPATIEATGNQDLGTSALAVALALVGLFAAHVLWGRRSRTTRRIAAATAPLERVLQEKFGFDRLYDWAFYRPAAALARGGARLWEQRVVIGSMDTVSDAGLLDEPPALDRAVGPRARVRAGDRSRHRGARRLVHDGRLVSGSWTSTLLWLVPLGGALLVLVLPLRDATRGALALIAALATTVLALAASFDFDPSGGTQFEQSHAWVRDIGLTYHVGMDGLSLVLVALTAVCVPCALGFGLWAKRPNMRAYAALMLAAGVGRRPAPRGPRPRALLRRLRGHDRAAGAADRRLGRPQPRARVDPLRDLHARRARC